VKFEQTTIADIAVDEVDVLIGEKASDLLRAG